MANLDDSAASWEAGIYQLETTDPVLGGAPNIGTGAGMSNIPALQLALRTKYLKGAVDQLQTGGGYRSIATFAGDQTLTASDMGKCLVYAGTTAVTLTLPLIADTPEGSVVEVVNTGTGAVTVARAGTNQIDNGPSLVTSIAVPANMSLRLLRVTGSSVWHVVSLTAASVATAFAAALTTAGYQKLPSGLIMQWGFTSSTGTTVENAAATFPIAFPSACLQVLAAVNGSSAGDYTAQPTNKSTTGCSFTAQRDGAYEAGIGLSWLAIGF